MSLTQVLERLFIGGIDDAKTLAESNPFGINTVIILSREKAPELSPDINYLHYPIGYVRPISVRQFDEIIDALWENLRWGAVLVHSRTGTNRAPILAAAWKHCCGYKNIDAALADIGKLRAINPNLNLLRSIKELL